MAESCAFQIIQDLYCRNRNFCSTDYDECLDYLHELLPFKLHTFRSATPYHGWVIPPKWDLIKAIIRYQGQVIFDVQHPLQIIGLSLPFEGRVPLDELKKHLHYDRRNASWTPYHFRQFYRPWERDWGFCVTKTFYDS